MKKSALPKLLFQPKKEFGQNFLFDKYYLQKIIEICPIDSQAVIVEIGSGYGDLTNLLAETNCQQIIGIEKDIKLFRWLEENKQRNDKITYLCEDALHIDWEKFCVKYEQSSLIIVGNLPYYITNSLIIDLLFRHYLFKSLIFLVQKEVGQKWVASPSKYSVKYSALSVFINHLAETNLIFEVPAKVFTPIPKVDGVLVVVNPKKNRNFSQAQLSSFLRFLKNCFRSRRKTLWNNLLSFSGSWEKEWEKYFLEKKHQVKIRPQNLVTEEYWELFLFWQKNNLSLKKVTEK